MDLYGVGQNGTYLWFFLFQMFFAFAISARAVSLDGPGGQSCLFLLCRNDLFWQRTHPAFPFHMDD